MVGESKRNDLGVGAPGTMQRLISELVQSDAWMRSLVDQSPLGISISHNGITLYDNQACARLFGSFTPVIMSERPNSPAWRLRVETPWPIISAAASRARPRQAPMRQSPSFHHYF